MKKSVVIMTGGDAKFFHYMEECLLSLYKLELHNEADIGILDLGLLPEQIIKLEAMGCKVVRPEWTLPISPERRIPHELGLVARTALRDYFTGYKVYLWFDADAWAQTNEFFMEFVRGAQETGTAIVRENGVGVSRNYLYNRWWYGHMIKAYGLIDGIRVAYKPAINIGIVAMSDISPMWDAWIEHYKVMIQKCDRTNLDQHAFNAAIVLDKIPATLISPRCNWITTLSHPTWDKRGKVFCEPKNGTKPISVIHLAGPEKRRIYNLDSLDGGSNIPTPLTFPAWEELRTR